MRYTTIIDIRELPLIWRNPNARQLYLYLVLASDYHDDRRDMLQASQSKLESETGLTRSAIRHALHLLEQAKLISRKGSVIRVAKWLPERAVTPRTQGKRLQQEQERLAAAREDRERQHAALNRERAEREKSLQEMAKSRAEAIIRESRERQIPLSDSSEIAKKWLKRTPKEYHQEIIGILHRHSSTH